MGYEARCTLRIGNDVNRGTAILEHRDLIFRGPTRVVIPLGAIASAVAQDGSLTVRFGRTTVVFDLGAVASRWADRITNPRSRLDKLGVKPGVAAMGIGERHAYLLRELKTRGARIVRPPPADGSDLIFYGASKRDMLDRLG